MIGVISNVHMKSSAEDASAILAYAAAPPRNAVTWRGDRLGMVNYGDPIYNHHLGKIWANVVYDETLEEVGISLPMICTTDVSNYDSNALVLTQRTKVYMLKKDNWGVSVDGWTDTGFTGSYLGSPYANAIKVRISNTAFSLPIDALFFATHGCATCASDIFVFLAHFLSRASVLQAGFA